MKLLIKNTANVKWRTNKEVLFFLSILLLTLPLRAKAQGFAVYDNTNFVSLTKQLAEAGKQTSKLVKTANFLKEQKENIERVNNVVKQLRAVREITRNNQRLVSTVNRDLRAILRSPYIKPNEVERVNTAFQGIVDNSLETMGFVEQILSRGLKMNDAERMTILKEKEEASKEMVSTIKRRTKRYNEIIAFREIQDKINNRETGF